MNKRKVFHGLNDCFTSFQYLSSGQSVAKDVHIQNGTIVASRLMLQAKELVATRPPTDLVRKVREIVDKYPYKIAIYHPNFIYSDLVNGP